MVQKPWQGLRCGSHVNCQARPTSLNHQTHGRVLPKFLLGSVKTDPICGVPTDSNSRSLKSFGQLLTMPPRASQEQAFPLSHSNRKKDFTRGWGFLSIYQLIVAMLKIFFGAKTCFFRVRTWYLFKLIAKKVIVYLGRLILEKKHKLTIALALNFDTGLKAGSTVRWQDLMSNVVELIRGGGAGLASAPAPQIWCELDTEAWQGTDQMLSR